MAAWVAHHRAGVGSAVGLLLLAAAGWGLYEHATAQRATEASAALARLEAEYRLAMGAAPNDMEVPEPANPETARQVRQEHAQRLWEVAQDHSGTAAAVVAGLEAGNRLDEAGDPDAAFNAWEEARRQAPRGSVLRGLVAVRLARAYEQVGRFEEAAGAFEEASEIDDFPLRHYALADAARCYANAGDRGRATALAFRLDAEAPKLNLPEHVRARLQELRQGTPPES
jgi:predicted negative regulator of RcsB-dependent stress response